VATIAYLRISTGGQNLDTQRLAILDYAQKHGLVIDTFVESQSSSRRTMGERGLRAVLDRLHASDTLFVSELSRLGRSVGQIIQLLDQLLKKEVTLVAIKENLKLRDTPDIQTKGGSTVNCGHAHHRSIRRCRVREGRPRRFGGAQRDNGT
jgi:DNA invertase Pin-like site-specific DNA recombinase